MKKFFVLFLLLIFILTLGASPLFRFSVGGDQSFIKTEALTTYYNGLNVEVALGGGKGVKALGLLKFSLNKESKSSSPFRTLGSSMAFSFGGGLDFTIKSYDFLLSLEGGMAMLNLDENIDHNIYLGGTITPSRSLIKLGNIHFCLSIPISIYWMLPNEFFMKYGLVLTMEVMSKEKKDEK